MNERPYSCHFTRAAHALLSGQPHLNHSRGGERAKRKKLDGSLALQLPDVTAILKAARTIGERKQIGGPAMLALLVNELLRDTLPEGAPLDVIARPAEGDAVPVSTREREELTFSVASADLLTTVEKSAADGVLDLHEETVIETKAAYVSNCTRRLTMATRREAKR